MQESTHMNARPPGLEHDSATAATRAWVERAIIGLNLCPFAKAVYLKDQVRFVVSEARSAGALLDDLEAELRSLSHVAAEAVDTTLLIHPHVLNDFLDYNDFLDVADAAVERLGLAGVIQVASFHPDYQFAGTRPDDVTNFTNRSPYPILHLLREASVDSAVAAFPDAELIYQRNTDTMRRLGVVGWVALGLPQPPSFGSRPPAPGS
jgi:hypothetical protein